MRLAPERTRQLDHVGLAPLGSSFLGEILDGTRETSRFERDDAVDAEYIGMRLVRGLLSKPKNWNAAAEPMACQFEFERTYPISFGGSVGWHQHHMRLGHGHADGAALAGLRLGSSHEIVVHDPVEPIEKIRRCIECCRQFRQHRVICEGMADINSVNADRHWQHLSGGENTVPNAQRFAKSV